MLRPQQKPRGTDNAVSSENLIVTPGLKASWVWGGCPRALEVREAQVVERGPLSQHGQALARRTAPALGTLSRRRLTVCSYFTGELGWAVWGLQGSGP